MSNLSLRHIYKVYSNGCKAVSDFNMEIEDKEFIVFVGPSGCGKSTTLRMIAGLEEISAGELYIDDVLVNDMEPKDRDISMVFQNYALYPHMTVYDNMAFGLKLRHVSQEEIHKKVLWAAQVLKLTDYLDRKPRAMSGGQRQRVALGRAILRNPKVFLLDEPLSNLDAKLRTEMRAEITKLHQTLGTTFIYVTHDQVEAMTLGTRVVVMKLGYVQQIDTPQNLYKYPTNKFVAGFIGTPQMNFFEAKLTRDNDIVKVDFEGCNASFKANFNDLIKVRPSYLKGEQVVTVGLRCENISVDPEVVKKSSNVMKVKVSHFEELGAETLIYGDMNLERDGFEDSNTRVIIKCYNGSGIKAGDIVEAAFDMSKAHFFDKNTEESIAPRVPSENVFDSKIKSGAIDFLGNKLILPPAILKEDMDNIELFIPSDAFNFAGNIKAKVIKTEIINKQILLHLEINKRIFFVLSDKEYKEGEEVKIGVDIKRIKVMKGEEIVIESLQNRNVFVGTYTNQQNDQKASKAIENYHKDIANKKIEKINHDKNIEIGKLGLNNILLKEYKKEYQKAKDDAQAELSLQVGTLDLGKDGKKKAKAECAEKIKQAKEAFAQHKIEYQELKNNVNSSPELKTKADEIALKYDEEIQNINNLTKEQIDEYIIGRRNSQEYIKQATIEEKQNYEKALSELSKKHDEDLAKFAIEINNASDVEKQNELKQQVAKLNEQYKEDKEVLLTNSKTFFININGHYVKSSSIITKKIVQALGIGIFNVNYRYEIALSSMKIANEGFKAEVIDILDYGEDKYILAKSHNNQLIVKADREYSKGEEIYIDFDIKDIHVFENKLDIRLY